MPANSPTPRLAWTSIFFLHRQLLLDRLAAVGHLFRGRVLDLGCNDKPYEKFLGSRSSRWFGLDRSTYAGDKTQADVLGDALHAPFVSGTFDTVLCTSVIQSIAEPAQLFEESFRLLRPGGHLVVSAHQYSAIIDAPSDYFRFTKFALIKLAADAGFDLVDVQPIGGSVALVCRVICGHTPFLNRGNPVSRVLSSIVQLIGYHLDRRFFRPGNTIAWLITCRKGPALV
jgi:SAM-dependent methyltransferase